MDEGTSIFRGALGRVSDEAMTAPVDLAPISFGELAAWDHRPHP
jgi:hypothetical protein